MKTKALHPAKLRKWFSDRFDRPLNSFLEAVDDDFFNEFIDTDEIIDIRLEGDKGKSFLPDAETLFFAQDGSDFGEQELPEQADLIVMPGVLQRADNPFRLLRAVHALLKDDGRLILSVPLRDVFEGKYLPRSYHAPDAHKRFYTLSSLFLELQAAWGFNSFRIRFAREYDGVPAGHGISDHYAFSLIMVVEKRPGCSSYPDVPRVIVERPVTPSNRSEDEALLDIGLSGILASTKQAGSIRRVCVLKLDHIGDFVMSLPVFDEIRAMFPDAEITCVCGSWNVSLARSLGCFDQYIACDYYGHDDRGCENSREAKAIAGQRLGVAMTGLSFDLAIDLRVPQDSRELIEIVPARHRAAIGTAEAFPFLDIALPSMEAFDAGLKVESEIAEIFVPASQFHVRGECDAPPGLKLFRPVNDGHKAIFGPYMALARGTYRLSWLLSTDGRQVDLEVDAALYDSARNHVERLSVATIQVDRSGARGTLDFELHAAVTNIEFRASVPASDEDVLLAFGGVRMESISGRPTIRHMPQAQIHIKEQMSLLLALVRNRLLAPLRPVADVRRRLGVTEERAAAPFFAIVPLSNSDLRNWPIEGFVALSRLILQHTTASIRLIGGPNQHAALEDMAERIAQDLPAGRVHNHAGRPWPEVYSSLVQTEAVISNNSGIAHVAAMLGGRVLALYSGSHQVLEWGPVGPEVRTLQASLPCGACGFDTLRECLHGHRCMHIITPAAVLASLRDMAPGSFVNVEPAADLPGEPARAEGVSFDA